MKTLNRINPIRNHLHRLATVGSLARIANPLATLAAVAFATLALANPSAHAAPVWNVNIGGQITTADNYAGAVPQSTPIHWNSITSSDSQVTRIYTAAVAIAPPLPEFTLTAPATWDGRQTITVQPDITNPALLQANNGTNFNYQCVIFATHRQSLVGTSYAFSAPILAGMTTYIDQHQANSWAANPAQGLTAGMNDGPLMDFDFDGVENLLEFVLKSPPMTSSTTALPAIQQDGGRWVFEYDRNDDSLPPATTRMVQYGSDLSGWTDITIPTTSSGAVTITPATPADHVRVVIPNSGGKVFARLKVNQ